MLFHMGNALLEWIFWFVSTDVWFTSQSGPEAHDLDSFQVNPNRNMMQNHCRNTPNVLRTLMDQTVYGRWLKLAWSKCLEISAWERSLAPAVSLYRPAAVRSHCFLRKHGQRPQTLWLYHKTHLLYDGVALGNSLISRQFSPCTEDPTSFESKHRCNNVGKGSALTQPKWHMRDSHDELSKTRTSESYAGKC